MAGQNFIGIFIEYSPLDTVSQDHEVGSKGLKY